MPDIGNAQEIAMTTSGGLGEAEVGGPSFSIVPKTGGNSLKGSAYASNVTKWMVGSNYSDELKARGLATPGELFKLWDYNVGIGGPIKKDRVWFFFQTRDEGSHRTVPGMFANANMGDATKWTYVADTSRPAVHAGSWRNGALRLTVQPNNRNKFNVFWDQQQPCQGAGYPGVENDGCRQSGAGEIICGAFGASNPACNATNAPETGTYLDGYGQRVQQATWTSPVTNKLLLEAGFGTYWSQWGGTPWPGSPFNNLILVNEQCTAGCSNNGGISGLNYRSTILGRHNLQGTTGWRASASYVTGASSMKFGYQGGYLIDNQFTYNNPQFVTFRVNNGIPNRITETINQIPLKQRVRYDAFYAQDQWTKGRFTVQGALRFDRAWSFFPEVTIPSTRFLPTEVNYQRTDGVTAYNDLTPRGGLAVDLFGNGKTSLKINVGKYLQAAQNGLTYGALRPSGRLQTTANRTWTDANGNFSPDCDLLNRGAQSPAATGSIDTCAAIDNANFGTEIFTSDLDVALRSGSGVRPGDWQYGVSIQQEILPRVSIEFGYNRRWLTAFNVVDNVLQASTDYDAFSITVPNDGLLPAGVGGKTVTGLYNANPRVAAQANNITKLATDFGTQTQTADGVLLNIAARPRFGLVFQGGMSAGVTHFDSCEIRAQLPETNAVDPYCSTSVKGIRYSGLASYTIPRVDVLVSGTFRSDQGTVLAANYTVTSAVVQQTLGRALSNAAPNVTVNLVEPGTVFGDRITEFDMRFAKILRFGRTRANVGFDVYNILNSAPVILYNQAYIPVGSAANPNGAWAVPTQVLTPRFAKFSIQFDF